MATNKHAIIRYQALDKCFRNPGRRYYIEDLVEACNIALYEFTGIENGVKRRQVLDDIKFMESEQGWNIPLERIRDVHRVYFRYEDKDFSINNQPLNETEENQLKEALLTLSRFKGLPQFEWVDEIAARLDSGLGLSHNNEKIIEFDQNNYLRGLEHITPIYNAILYKKAIKLTYKSFRQEHPQTIILHPYFLKQYNNRWFLFGNNDDTSQLMNLALDRIEQLEESNKRYILNKTLDFNEYFEDVIGVTVGNEGKTEHIVLKVQNSLLPYIETKPIHGSQKIKERATDYALVTLDIIPNYEFESLLLSMGENVTIMKPQTLRLKLNDRIKAMQANYK
jgi:predicted DNA-binding transcriptional regulator YafY